MNRVDNKTYIKPRINSFVQTVCYIFGFQWKHETSSTRSNSHRYPKSNVQWCIEGIRSRYQLITQRNRMHWSTLDAQNLPTSVLTIGTDLIRVVARCSMKTALLQFPNKSRLRCGNTAAMASKRESIRMVI